MTSHVIPLTELEAVNHLLGIIGEAPINSISDAAEQSPDATIARQTLANYSRTFQSKGWSWNTDLEYELSPNTDGEIELPYNCVSLNILESFHTDRGRYVKRGNRLYDRKKHTFKIDNTITADVVVLLSYDDLPHSVRDYVTKSAARHFQHAIQGETANYRYSTEDLMIALANAENNDTDGDDTNFLRNGMSSISLRILGRRGSGR